MCYGVRKFEEIGAELQWNAKNAGQAKKLFKKSCDICCDRGLNIECKHCHIQAAHDFVMEFKFGEKVEGKDEEA